MDEAKLIIMVGNIARGRAIPACVVGEGNNNMLNNNLGNNSDPVCYLLSVYDIKVIWEGRSFVWGEQRELLDIWCGLVQSGLILTDCSRG